MRFACFAALALLLLSSGPALPAAKPALPEKYAKWLKQDVAYIITSEEKSAFLKLTSGDARDKFIAEFWEARNPHPGSKENEFKIEHYKRIAEANELFGHRSNTPGWMTDQGRTWILFGKPESRHSFTGYGQIYPLELWFYENKTGSVSLPPFFSILFFMPEDVEEFRYYRPSLDGPLSLVRGSQFNSNRDVYRFLQPLGGDVARASLSLIPDDPVDTTSYMPDLASDLLIARIRNFANDPFNVKRIREARALRTSVESRLLLPGQKPLEIASIVATGAGGNHWLDYAVTIGSSELGKPDAAHKRLQLDIAYSLLSGSGELIAQNRERRAFPAFGENGEFQPFQLAGRLPVLPGSYRLTIVASGGEAGYIFRGERRFIVENTNETALSGPLLASSVERVGKADGTAPFQFFGFQFHPIADRTLDPGAPLRLLFDVQLAPGQPQDCQLEYVVASISNRALRRAFKENVPAKEFREGRLLKAKTLNLNGLEDGEYRLVINLRRAGSPEVLASSTLPLKLGAGAASPRLYFFEDTRQLGAPGVADYLRGLEALSQKDGAAAERYLRSALGENPKNVFAAGELVQLYSQRREDGEIAGLYKQMGMQPFQGSAEALAQIAMSLWKIGEPDLAREVVRSAKESFPKDPMVLAAAKTVN